MFSRSLLLYLTSPHIGAAERRRTLEHSMVPRTHDQDPPADRGGPEKRGYRGGDHRCPHPRVQPEPGHRQHLRRQAPAHRPQPGRPGRPRPEQTVGRPFPRSGPRRAGDGRQNGKRREPVLRHHSERAEGSNRQMAGEGPGGPSGAGHGGGGAQRGQVHLHQQGSPEEVGQGGGPARCHPGQAVGKCGSIPGPAGHPWHSVAQV